MSANARRKFLRIAGGGAVLLAAGSGAWLATRRPSGALEPWRIDETRLAPRLKALSYAILSPSPHNQQPWLIDLATPDRAVVYLDHERLLPETDPLDRQITIGLGCFLECLRISASAYNMKAEIEPFPDGAGEARLDKRPVATIVFTEGGVKDPLFDQILRRRTNRQPYDLARPPSQSDFDALERAASMAGVRVRGTASADKMGEIRDLFWRSLEREALTPAKHGESVDLMRIGRSEIEKNPDGISLGGAFFETLSLIGALSREQLADPTSSNFAQTMDVFRDMTANTPAALWLTTSANTRLDQIAAGGAWLRAQLKATELGLSMQPMSQPLQEYPEMADLYDEAQALFDAPQGGVVQMAARLGVGPEVDPSPRWPLKAKLIS